MPAKSSCVITASKGSLPSLITGAAEDYCRPSLWKSNIAITVRYPKFEQAIRFRFCVIQLRGGSLRISYLICYDICDDKRLRKVFQTMRGYGDHLQYSVFEPPARQSPL